MDTNIIHRQTDFNLLSGQTIKSIDGLKRGSEEVIFTTDKGKYKMYHEQDCCESVYVEDICGDIEDIIGLPIVEADEVVYVNINPYDYDIKEQDPYGSFTWTFYKLSTIKGSITLRWYGESNGYYSEKVSFEKIKESGDDSDNGGHDIEL